MAWWRIGKPYSALVLMVRLGFRAREGKPPMTNESDRDRGRGRAVECGVGGAAEAERLERERDEEDGVGIE
jgi:hypothetical protein